MQTSVPDDEASRELSPNEVPRGTAQAVAHLSTRIKHRLFGLARHQVVRSIGEEILNENFWLQAIKLRIPLAEDDWSFEPEAEPVVPSSYGHSELMQRLRRRHARHSRTKRKQSTPYAQPAMRHALNRALDNALGSQSSLPTKLNLDAKSASPRLAKEVAAEEKRAR